jgi:hypothetical protein
MLTLKQVNDICLFGQASNQCRFLAEDNKISGKFYCLKLIKQQKKEIDLEVDDFIKRYNAQGIDPNSTGFPLGDNCSGYLYMTSTLQGYDIDNKVP